LPSTNNQLQSIIPQQLYICQDNIEKAKKELIESQEKKAIAIKEYALGVDGPNEETLCESLYNTIDKVIAATNTVNEAKEAFKAACDVHNEPYFYLHYIMEFAI
jgi:hypothetical protein